METQVINIMAKETTYLLDDTKGFPAEEGQTGIETTVEEQGIDKAYSQFHYHSYSFLICEFDQSTRRLNILKEYKEPSISRLQRRWNDPTYNDSSRLFQWEQRFGKDSLQTWYSFPYSQVITLSTLDYPIKEFCKRLGIEGYIQKALNLATSLFPSARGLRLRPEEDPETGDEWLAIDMTVEADVDEFLDAYDEYVESWQEAVPWPASSKIVLSYNIL